jgi:arylsulfatase A
VKKLLLAIALMALVNCATKTDSKSSASKKINIVLIMADDLGFECIGANGCESYKTPNIDKMASKGMRFTNCFANPICTPSRNKIMTGQYNVRNYVKFAFLDRKQKTFAHLLKGAGYKTCIAGKWQLGHDLDSPQHFGFEESCLWQHTRTKLKEGTKFDSRFSNPCLEINGVEKNYTNGEYGPDICAEFVCDFIETNKDKPFLVYYPMILTHCPFVPAPGTKDWDPKSPGFKGYKGNAKYFKGMVEHMDKIIGRINNKLVSLNLDKNTVVFFTGDNGTDRPVKTVMNGQTVSWGKGQLNDNGTRVPLIVSGLGVKAGLVSDELVDFTDFLPTLCDISGATQSKKIAVDGQSLWSTLQSKEGRDKPWVYFWYGRHGEYKTVKVLARNKTHMVLRQQMKASPKFIDCSKPYELKIMKEDKVHKSLVEVIQHFDKARPEHLRKEPKKKIKVAKNKKKAK